MSTPIATPTTPTTNFDGIHVSKGFVRGLQGQVLKLEQVQQSLIHQLEHANKLASEYHASAVTWHQKYDTALHEIEKMKQAFENERKQLSSYLNEVVDLYEREKKLRLTREQEMMHLEQLLADQTEMSTSRSPSPVHHPHRNGEESLQAHSHSRHEPMSPVSIPDDNDNDDNDDDNDSALNEFYGNYYPNDAYSQSSQTTDCSGDPICHSDSD
jgi:hypothetical protein